MVSSVSLHRIDGVEPAVFMVEDVIADHHPSFVHDDDPVEIMENKESPEEEPRMPKRIGTP